VIGLTVEASGAKNALCDGGCVDGRMDGWVAWQGSTQPMLLLAVLTCRDSCTPDNQL